MLATLVDYLWMPAVFGLTCLPLVMVLPSAPPLVDDAPTLPLVTFPWRIHLTLTIARSSPKEQPL